jgi:hypothetical protein
MNTQQTVSELADNNFFTYFQMKNENSFSFLIKFHFSSIHSNDGIINSLIKPFKKAWSIWTIIMINMIPLLKQMLMVFSMNSWEKREETWNIYREKNRAKVIRKLKKTENISSLNKVWHLRMYAVISEAF